YVDPGEAAGMEGGVRGGMGEQLPEPVALVRSQPGPVPAQPAKVVGQPRRELGCCPLPEMPGCGRNVCWHQSSSIMIDGSLISVLCTVQCRATARKAGRCSADTLAGTRTVTRMSLTRAGWSLAMTKAADTVRLWRPYPCRVR